MRIGDRDVSRDTACEIVNAYARRFGGTVLHYDLAGDPDGTPGPGHAAEPVNAVTLADIGRLVVINANLAAQDVVTLMSVDAGPQFAAVPTDARLEDCAPGSDLEARANALYDRYRFPDGSNIGGAKRSKLLHLKRPWLFPIYDSHINTVYGARVAASPEDNGYWEAARQDLIDDADDFAWLTERLAASDEIALSRASRLSALRLLDILAWQLGSAPSTT